jgi:antitoxin component YwqK of YwqJK toxin-antitoxin module
VPELRGERGYEEEGYFVNDLKEGIWKKFSPEGVKIAEENYRWGKLHGKQLYYSFNGGLIREESWRAMDPANAYDTVAVYDLKDPDKLVGEVVVKNEGLSMRNGRFMYYDPRTGSILQTEQYVMNKLQEEAAIMPLRDTTPKALPRVIQEFDKKKKRN